MVARIGLEQCRDTQALAEGTRRDATITVGEPHVIEIDDGIEVTFTLPGGTYATAVMREVMK